VPVPSRCRTLLAAIAALALGASACGSGSSPTATPTPTPVSAPLVADTFTGTLAKGGTALHQWTVNITGIVQITLVSLVPQSTISMGLGTGTPGAAGCNVTSAQENFSQGTVITGTMNAGTYCLVFWDAANAIVGTDDYKITVTHF